MGGGGGGGGGGNHTGIGLRCTFQPSTRTCLLSISEADIIGLSF